MNHPGQIATILALSLSLLISAPVHAQEGATNRAEEPETPTAYVTAGVGLPTIAHIEAGYYVNSSTSVDLIAALIVFNAMAGIGATQWFSLASGNFDHDLGISVHGYLNILDEPFEFESSGERLGFVADAMLAYAFTLEAGFTIRTQLGVLIYDDNGVAVSPNLTAMAGWRF